MQQSPCLFASVSPSDGGRQIRIRAMPMGSVTLCITINANPCQGGRSFSLERDIIERESERKREEKEGERE